MSESALLILFIVLIVGILLLDLMVIGRKSHVISFREAGIWSSVWIMLALVFFLFLRFSGEIIHNINTHQALIETARMYYPAVSVENLSFELALKSFRKALSYSFLAGYLVEESLSLDNLFVILMIFNGFKVPQVHYKRILFWGVLGAVMLRFLFIFLGAALIQRFEWILYIFGVFLLFTGGKMLFKNEKQDGKDAKDHPVIRFVRKILPVSEDTGADRFFIWKNKKLWITPLFLVLILVEFTDLIFAMDSIPAIFGITRDPLIVFYSNVFAILGLRSLFFLLANLSTRFRFLKTGISVILFIIGIKLILHHWMEEIGFRPAHSLLLILLIIGSSILLSIIFPQD